MEIVLVPGLWLDGSSWDEVVPVLERAGHRTHALTLPGMTRDADRAGITLRDHVAAVVAVIDSLAPAKVVLVGHSGGGAVAHAAVDARPDRVARVVYVDTWPLGAGHVVNDGFPAENGEIPLPDWSLFDDDDLVDLDDELRARFRERALPSPARVPCDPQRLSDERRYDVPATVIACAAPSAKLREWLAAGEPVLAELGKLRDVSYVDLPTGHWPQFTRPAELGEAILASLAPTDRHIRDVADVLELLDGLFAREADRWTTGGGASWWDGFYADRDRPVPFFVAKPDENLVAYLDRGLLAPGRALDLGCGAGRNALHLAAAGFTVDAVDLAPAAIAWATERAAEAGADVRFHLGDAFALAETDLRGPYDLVYDSGCFHHLPPHRRISYRALLDRVLAPGGHLALTCFAAGAMGSEVPDAELYRKGRLDGGLAYSPESLRWIFADLTEVELRRMRAEPAESPHFGESFLWTALFRRDRAII